MENMDARYEGGVQLWHELSGTGAHGWQSTTKMARGDIARTQRRSGGEEREGWG